MLQTVRCIKFGEVLLDKNRAPFLLCRNCHTDFMDLAEFRTHLDSCSGLENLFRKNAALVFDSTKGHQLFGQSQSGELKEYRVYEPSEVQKIEAVEQPTKLLKDDTYIDLYKIEEELLDPRWYTDLNSVQPTIINTEPQNADKMLEYNELVEAVTPYVQFKENSSSGSSRNGGAGSKTEKSAGKHMLIRRLTVPPPSSSNDIVLTNVAASGIILSMDSPEQQQKIVAPKLSTQPPALARRKTIAIPMESPRIEPPLDAEFALNLGQTEPVRHTTPRNTLNNHQLKKSCTATRNPVPPLVKLSQPQPALAISTVAQPHRPLPTKISRQSHGTPVQQQQSQQPILLVARAKGTARANGHAAQQAIALPSNSHAIVGATPLIQQAPPPKTKQTEQILNKLQTLGLQVKRRSNPPPICFPDGTDGATAKTDETKELLQKLRLKGMNVKLLNKNERPVATQPSAKRPKLLEDTVAASTAKSKTIVIRQVK